MTITVSKKSISKTPLVEMFYRGYKTFEEWKFKYELKKRIEHESFNVIVNLKTVL